jgi:hypothetical protein
MGVTYNYGAGPTYTKIASQTLGSAAASVTFSSIPQGYTDLILVSSLRNATGNNYNAFVQFNGDTSTNYSSTHLYGTGSVSGSGRDTTTSLGIRVGYSNNSASTFSPNIANIMNYSNGTTYKSVLSRTNDINTIAMAVVGIWRNTSPITSLAIIPESPAQWQSGSTFTIYGIAAALKPKAVGGNKVSTDGTYWYHTFTSSGTFTPTVALTADVLVVAGGGGGGHPTGGQAAGGGAGGLLSFSSQSLGVSSYTCTVGAGGAVASANNLPGSNGETSQFGGLTASVGGGGGGSGNGPTGISGGSGGGGASVDSGTSTPGTGTVGQGNNGGAGNGAPNYAAAGGGGAGAVGGSASSGNAGSGGIGATSSLINSMGIGTGTGQLSSGNYYFAGGGAGMNGVSPTQTPTGGLGGGGASITAGTANTGGGGGGRAAGGSGIVIVRYSI